MRGRSESQTSMFCLLNPEDLIPSDHPLRGIKEVADEALKSIDETLSGMYGSNGRPSIPPERLLKSMLLMALYSIRSDRQLREQIQYNMLFRWFLDMTMTEPVFDRTVLSHNRERLIEHDVARALFGAIVDQAREAQLLSEEHFSVDGTLIEAWASMKSFGPREEDDDDDPKGPRGSNNRWADFRNQKRSNKTHASTTDPDAKLMRKGRGREAKLSYGAHALMDNRHALIVDMRVTEANGTAERTAALEMLGDLQGTQRVTVGADRGYDTRDFVANCRDMNVTPHVAQYNAKRKPGIRQSAIDRRTTRHVGYDISQIVRRNIEAAFGWTKKFGGLRRTRFKGRPRVTLDCTLIFAALNTLRVAKLCAPVAA